LFFCEKKKDPREAPMVTTLHPKRPHTIKIEFAPHEPVTSLGGLALAERMAMRLGLWRLLEERLPERRGQYDWSTCIKAQVLGLLSGGQGTYGAEGLRNDPALLKLLSLGAAPEEATVWRTLEDLGRFQEEGLLPEIQLRVGRTTLGRMRRADLLLEDLFVPVFNDGSLLEGSGRREGTKWIKEKGSGLLWSTTYVGPVLVAQRLAGPGQGEQSCVREMLGQVDQSVLRPLKLKHQTLVLMDSLHGDEPTLRQLEEQGLHYVVGVNKLTASEATLVAQPEVMWERTGANRALGWSDSGVCVCWLQCAKWPAKRLLVGRRWMKEGEMIWNYAGIVSDLRERDVAPIMRGRRISFGRALWRLYDAKAGMETYYKEPLSDLGLHYPPCQEFRRNAGFYAVGALAALLGRAVDLIGGADAQRGSQQRRDGGQRKRPKPRSMRLWRLRRELFTLPARVRRHGHELVVEFLGVSEATRHLIERYWGQILRC
jgi:hypothetical protein